MKNISISKKKYNELQNLYLPNDVLNTEAKILRLNRQGKELVLKSFMGRLNGQINAIKSYNVQMLDTYRDILPKEFVIPEYKCTVGNEEIGFVMPYIEGVNFEHYLKDKNVDFKDKLYFLREAGSILEQLDHIRSHSPLDIIYINDFQPSNFIVNPVSGEIKVVDLDSCRIADGSTLPARFLLSTGLTRFVSGNKYEINDKNSNYDKEYDGYKDYKNIQGYVKANKNSDLYCLAITFLNYIANTSIGRLEENEYYEYLGYLKTL